MRSGGAWGSCPIFHAGWTRGAILAIMPTLAVIGAGPKGIAIAAKARALTAAGLPAPRVVLVERGPVAGNWTGRQGYTSGLLPLGTPPEKDVGYPYAESWGGALGRGHRGDGGLQLAAAPDRPGYLRRLGGPRPPAAHPPAVKEYLREVANRVEAEIVAAEAVGLEVDGERWRLAGRSGGADLGRRRGGHRRGPADPRARPAASASAGARRTQLLAGRATPRSGQMAMNACVIGSGETAAAVVISLLGKAAQAVGHRRPDQQGSPLLAGREPRGEPLVFRPGGLARAGRGAPARVPRAHRPGRVLAAGRGGSQCLARIPCARRAGGSGSTRVTGRSSSPSSTVTSASASPITWSSWPSASMLAGSRRSSATKRADASARGGPRPGSSGGSTSTCRWPA